MKPLSHITNYILPCRFFFLFSFDLDACLWDVETFELDAIPTRHKVMRGDLNGRGEGIIGVYSGRYDIVSLHKGALLALQEHADNTLYPGMKVALASSATTPFAVKIARASLNILEVFPGRSVMDSITRDFDGMDVNQIGRDPPLSGNKAQSHFPLLHKATNIRYDRMLFFDDCNWGDHCAMVEAACQENDTGKGVTTFRTPHGIGVSEWRRGMEKDAKEHREES